MAKKNRKVLKSYFEAGKIPTQQQYEELIDSMLNLSDDGIDNSKNSSEDVDKDIQIAQGLLLTPGGCLNAVSVHNFSFPENKNVKIQTNIPYSLLLTVQEPPLLIVEGHNITVTKNDTVKKTTVKHIGFKVAFEYEYNEAFTISNLDDNTIRQGVEQLATTPQSGELIEIKGKKIDANNKEIDATWIIDSKHSESPVWEVNNEDPNDPTVEESTFTLAELNQAAGLKVSLNDTISQEEIPLQLSIEEKEGKIALALLEKKASSSRVSFNIRAVSGKKGYEYWYKGWRVTAEEILADKTQ